MQNHIEIFQAKGSQSTLLGEPTLIEHPWGKVRQCRAILVPDREEGGYVVYAAELEGVVSQGDTETEAIENIKEAFAAAVECYLKSGIGIPWGEVEIDPDPERLERWVTVNVG